MIEKGFWDLEQGNRDDWVKIIKSCTRDLHDRVERQQAVLLTMLGESKRPTLTSCVTPDCPHRKLFSRVLLETIEGLEETRKSFKSKRLEELRTTLIRVLKEAE